jgi:hypothetical protein
VACPSIGISTKPILIRFIYYKLLTLVPVSAAITAMLRQGDSFIWPILYVAVCLTHAGIMNAAKCPHCPYYKMGAGTFSCFIWWGTPKLWAEREGPERAWVGKYASFGMAVLVLFPVYWLIREWPLLLIYLFGIGGLVLSIGLNECSRCLNFNCAHCTVPKDLRREYLEALS